VGPLVIKKRRLNLLFLITILMYWESNPTEGVGEIGYLPV